MNAGFNLVKGDRETLLGLNHLALTVLRPRGENITALEF